MQFLPRYNPTMNELHNKFGRHFCPVCRKYRGKLGANQVPVTKTCKPCKLELDQFRQFQTGEVQ